MSAGEPRVWPQARRVSAAGRIPEGMTRQIQSATTIDATATRAKAQRQLAAPAIHADRGMPITEATDQPRNTKVMARPRWAGPTIRPTLAAACGVKMAGEITARMRSGNSVP
jgi:hypothetical protein